MKPRTVRAPVNELADTVTRMSIFGGGKPRDEKEYEEKAKDEDVPRRLSQSEDQDSDKFESQSKKS